MYGAVAQLGERLLCKQDVIGSIPVSSTNLIHCIQFGAFFREGFDLEAGRDLTA